MMMYTYHTHSARPELMMDRMLRSLCDVPDRSRRSTLTFPVDLRQTEDAYFLEAELPGVKLGDIELTLENDVLTIVANVNMVSNETRESYVHAERRSGRMERSFTLEGIREADITASCADGILTVTLPKEAPENGKEKRRIAISGSAPEVVKLEAPAE